MALRLVGKNIFCSLRLLKCTNCKKAIQSSVLTDILRQKEILGCSGRAFIKQFNSSQPSLLSSDTESNSLQHLQTLESDSSSVKSVTDITNEESGSEFDLTRVDTDDNNLQPMVKHVVEPKFHLGEYVSQSETLSQLVKLGVDLTSVQRVRGAANMIVKMDFDTDVKPYLYFLQDVGISDKEMGHYISKNPLILKERLEDLQARVGYLQSKRFSTDAISRIVGKAHVFLLMSVPQVDSKLGYLQKEYKLSGEEVRSVVTRLPKLVTWNLQKLKDNRFYIKEFLGFSDAELHHLILSCPKILLTNRYSLGRKFDYLYNTMQLNHAAIMTWPKVLLTRLHVIQQRHRFLLSVERAQYDPNKENYVSAQALVSGRDRDFCWNVAKSSATQYNNFLKSI